MRLKYALYRLGVHYILNDTLAKKGICMWRIVYIPGVSYVYLENSSYGQITPHTVRYIGPRGRYTMRTWDIHHTKTTQHTDTMDPEEGLLCVPWVYNILTYSTQNTDRYNETYGRYTMCTMCTWSIHTYWPTVHSTQIDTMTLMEDILCVPGVYIIRPHSTLSTVKWVSRSTMCIWGIHHIDSKYITHG